MRILLLSQWFTPEPTFKGLTFAKELVRLGHQVEVLTGFPNYPGGKLYGSYCLKLFQRELMDGVTVLRVPLYPSHNLSAVERIANYGSFALSASTMGVLTAPPPDVMYVYHPPATVGLPAIIFHLLRRIPFVYDIQDLWPDTLAATGMFNSKSGLSLVGNWCSFIYRKAAKIVVLSPGFKKILGERGVPESKVEVIYNWCEEELIRPGEGDEKLAEQLGMKNHFNVLFAGTMGKAQALDAVLDAAQLLREKCSQIQFVFIGGGIDAERLRRRALDRHLDNVLFLPRRPISQIGAVLNIADVLLIHLKDDPLFTITIPSKTQAYMAAGRPILIAVKGDAADLVTKAGAGIACTPEDSHSIAESVLALYNLPRDQLEAMGRNGRMFYDDNLSLRVGALRFEHVFKQTAGFH
jgi:colanic acid biosynthesis glycosyl transferase WcaI